MHHNYILDYSKLFAAVYITPMASEPFLWKIYPELTLQQICGQLLDTQLSDKHPVLFTYLSEVSLNIMITACMYTSLLDS